MILGDLTAELEELMPLGISSEVILQGMRCQFPLVTGALPKVIVN